jgi:hypothetical protein
MIPGMGGFRNRCLAGFLLVPGFAAWLAACQSPANSLDLRRNADLYRSPGYRARLPVDRSAFLTPLVDARSGRAVEARGPYPISAMPDGYWARPLPEMIEQIVRDELNDSGVVVGLQRQAPPKNGALVITVHLLEAVCGQEERPSGRRSMADVALRVQVFGPAPGTTLLFDRQFRQPLATDVGNRPARPPQLFGIALRQVVGAMLAALDQSNVARSGVPIQHAVDAAERR